MMNCWAWLDWFRNTTAMAGLPSKELASTEVPEMITNATTEPPASISVTCEQLGVRGIALLRYLKAAGLSEEQQRHVKDQLIVLRMEDLDINILKAYATAASPLFLLDSSLHSGR